MNTAYHRSFTWYLAGASRPQGNIYLLLQAFILENKPILLNRVLACHYDVR